MEIPLHLTGMMAVIQDMLHLKSTNLIQGTKGTQGTQGLLIPARLPPSSTQEMQARIHLSQGSPLSPAVLLWLPADFYSAYGGMPSQYDQYGGRRKYR